MRKVGIALLLIALVLGLARLCTGIVYRADVPVAALVLKRAPDFAIERAETAVHPLDRDIVIDREEPTLFYGRPYVWLMRAAPVLVLVMVAGAAILLSRRKRCA